MASDGSTAQVLIAGAGFVEGVGSEYRLGTEVIGDTLANAGPDVFGRSDPVLGFVPNGYVRMTVPLSSGGVRRHHGQDRGWRQRRIQHQPGVSITSTAFSGTPADPAQASANAGQTITLNGSGLTTTTDVLMRWTDINGNLTLVRVSPNTANGDGTQATLVVPA